MSTQSNPIENLLAEDVWARRLATALVGPARSDDLVQQAYLAAVEGKYAPDGRPRAWLGRVLRNAAANLHREGARRLERERLAAPAERLTDTPETIESRLEQRGLLVELLLDLPEEQRTAIVLKYEEGLRARAIAVRVGCAEATVRVRIKRGLDRIRQRLDERHAGVREDWMRALTPLLVRRSTATGIAGIGLQTLIGSALAAAACGALYFGLRPDSRTAPEQHLGAAPVLVAQRESTASAPGPAPEREAPGAQAASTAPGGTGFGALIGAAASLLGPESTLEIAFIDEANLPLPFVRVTLEAYGRQLTTTADARGAATLSTRLITETMSVRLVGAGSDESFAELEFVATPGEHHDLGVLQLHPGFKVSGSVARPDGAPAANAHVGLLPAEQQLSEDQRQQDYLPGTSPRARASSDGQFELRSTLSGTYRTWFRGVDSWWTAGPELELQHGAQAGPLALRLRSSDLRPPTTIRFKTSDGSEPERLWYLAKFEDGGRQYATHLNEPTIVLAELYQRGTVVEVQAADRATGEGLRWTGELSLGDPDLTLWTAPLPPVEVLVRGLGASSPDACDLQLRGAAGAFAYSAVTELEPRDGSARLTLGAPNAAFTIRAEVAGFRRLDAGPFPPGTSLLELDLEPLPALALQVFEQGKPLPECWVELIGLAASEKTQLYNGFPSLYGSGDGHTRQADSSGRVTLYPEGEDARFVRVWSEHDNPRVLELPPGPLAGEHRIEFEASGEVRGRVQFEDGSFAAGLVIAIANGAFDVRTRRVGRSGKIRFRDLPPGTWYLYRTPEEQLEGSYSTRTYDRPLEANWAPHDQIEVTPGATAEIELRLPVLQAPELVGSLSIDGRPAAGWRASTRPGGDFLRLGDPRERVAVALDEQGHARWNASGGGLQRLVLEPPPDVDGPSFALEFESLDAGATWELAVELGHLPHAALSATWSPPLRAEGIIEGTAWTWSADLSDPSLAALPVGPATLRDAAGAEWDLRVPRGGD